MTLAEMQFVLPDLRIAGAEIFMLAMTCLVLVVDLFVKNKNRTVTYVLTQLALVGTAAITLATSSGQISYTFSNMFVSDLMADLLKFLVYLSVMVVLFYCSKTCCVRCCNSGVSQWVDCCFPRLANDADHFVGTVDGAREFCGSCAN